MDIDKIWPENFLVKLIFEFSLLYLIQWIYLGLDKSKENIGSQYQVILKKEGVWRVYPENPKEGVGN
jgi:hypothetical protein